MKKLLMAAALVSFAFSPAQAGYNYTNDDVAAATSAEADAVDSNCKILAFDTDADGDGTADNLDANSSGDAVYYDCDDIAGFGIDNLTFTSSTANTVSANAINKVLHGSISVADLNSGGAILLTSNSDSLTIYNPRISFQPDAALTTCTGLKVMDSAASSANDAIISWTQPSGYDISTVWYSSSTIVYRSSSLGTTAGAGLVIEGIGGDCGGAAGIEYVLEYTLAP